MTTTVAFDSVDITLKSVAAASHLSPWLEMARKCLDSELVERRVMGSHRLDVVSTCVYTAKLSRQHLNQATV